MKKLVAFLIAWAALFQGEAAPAQSLLTRPSRLTEQGRSSASADDSTALLLNPANLSFLPSAELRWTGTFLGDTAQSAQQGNALSFAFPLGDALGTGLRVDFVNPPADAELGVSLGDVSYQWLTWGVGARLSQGTSIGFSLQRSFSSGVFGNDLASYSVAVSSRPWDFLGLSFVGHDMSGPGNVAGQVGRSLTLAAAIRPLLDRSVELSTEVTHYAQVERWVPRAVVGVDVPYVGRVRGEVQLGADGQGLDSFVASLGVSFYLNQRRASTEATAGAMLGEAMGPNGGVGLQAGFAARGFAEPVGLDLGVDAVKLRMRETPSVRAHVGWLRRLWALAESDTQAVVLQLEAEPAESLAHAQELRDSIELLRQSGKRVACYMQEGGALSLYVCSAADQFFLHPAGDLGFAGLRNRYTYYGRLLEKLGVRAEVVAIGKHKSAPESFTRSGASEVARADKIDLLQQAERQFTEAVASGRKLSFSGLRGSFEKGPFLPDAARQAGLVDGALYEDELDEKLSEVWQREVRSRSVAPAKVAPDHFRRQRGIALVYVEGEMVVGDSEHAPLIGARSAGSRTITAALEAARKDSHISAVVLRVETPGGSSTAADMIWREVKRTAKEKPVIVSMGGYAASGGYYISSMGTKVLANPFSITGSIGVFYGKADLSQLLQKVGIDVEVYKTNEGADASAFYRPFTEAERAGMQARLEQVYQMFLSRVAEGRKMDTQAVDAVAQGRVWTGEQAVARGLADEVGGLRQALQHARTLTGLPKDAPIIELPGIPTSLVQRALGAVTHATTDVSQSWATLTGQDVVLERPGNASRSILERLPLQLKDLWSSLTPLVVHPSGTVLTRLPLVTTGPGQQ